MSESIKDCPQPETPIRERAWTDEQKADMHREAFDLFRRDLEERLCKVSPPEHMTSLRAEYWKAGARRAIYEVNLSLKAALRYRDEQDQTSVWRCYKEYLSGDGGRVHSEKFAKTKADMLIFKSQGYDCEKLSDEQEKQA